MAPNLDMVLGIYYLTGMDEKEEKDKISTFDSRESAIFAHEVESLALREPIKLKINDEYVETTVGRLLWHEIIPEELGFRNQQFTKSLIEDLVADCYGLLGKDVTTVVLDDIDDISNMPQFLEQLLRSRTLLLLLKNNLCFLQLTKKSEN